MFFIFISKFGDFSRKGENRQSIHFLFYFFAF